MTKKILLSLIAVVILALNIASCNRIPHSNRSSDIDETTDPDSLLTIENLLDSTEEDTSQTEEVLSTEETVSSTKKDDYYAEQGKGYKLGDWEVTVNSLKFTDKIQNGQHLNFTPDEGNKYLAIDATVVNNAKTALSFLESFASGNYVSVKVIYKQEYEYEALNLSDYNDGLYDLKIQPLSYKAGTIVITMPETVINDLENAELIFTYNRTAITYKLS